MYWLVFLGLASALNLKLENFRITFSPAGEILEASSSMENGLQICQLNQ